MSQWVAGFWGLDEDGTLRYSDGEKFFKLPLKISAILQRLQHNYAKDENGELIIPQDSPCRSWGFVFSGKLK
jgi:hypothetical protein